MACGCNKKGNVTNTNNVSGGQQKQGNNQKLPLVTTNSSSAKKTALANVSKKISNRQK
jgi:hypothetical protein